MYVTHLSENTRFNREFSYCLHHDHTYTYCICITLFLILPNWKRDDLVSLHGDGVKDGISAFCTTSGIESNIVTDMSIKQTMQIHFWHIPLPVSFQINKNTLHAFHIVLLHFYLSTLANICRNTHFHSVIWYLRNSYSDRFQTFTVEKVCFLQC